MKKIISSLAFASILVSGLYAQEGKSCDIKKDRQHCDINKKDGNKHSKQDNKRGSHFGGGYLRMFNELNLSAEQKTKINDIIKESRKQELYFGDAFSKDSFDKAKFIKMMKDKREKREEIQADILDKTYKVLDSKQKEQFKVLLDLKKEKIKQSFEDKK
ncbi:Spy/CpxP family protein refolding chaperone [Arcobacter vandammei]|uniref:Spy/CpxP family protein refolding chaperone n=1 Tax=Arcobacter vandammei TaxID=2782243 RepID=UPI0018DEF19B|nr:hypothetical protein [Arcobacter vandammei]